METSKSRKRLSFVFLAALGFFWVIPIIWLLLNSFKTDSDFITSFSNLKGPIDYASRLWPKNFTTVNYVELLQVAPGNTGLIAGVAGDARTWGGTVKFSF